MALYEFLYSYMVIVTLGGGARSLRYKVQVYTDTNLKCLPCNYLFNPELRSDF